MKVNFTVIEMQEDLYNLFLLEEGRKRFQKSISQSLKLKSNSLKWKSNSLKKEEVDVSRWMKMKQVDLSAMDENEVRGWMKMKFEGNFERGRVMK